MAMRPDTAGNIVKLPVVNREVVVAELAKLVAAEGLAECTLNTFQPEHKKLARVLDTMMSIITGQEVEQVEMSRTRAYRQEYVKVTHHRKRTDMGPNGRPVQTVHTTVAQEPKTITPESTPEWQTPVAVTYLVAGEERKLDMSDYGVFLNGHPYSPVIAQVLAACVKNTDLIYTPDAEIPTMEGYFNQQNARPPLLATGTDG